MRPAGKAPQSLCFRRSVRFRPAPKCAPWLNSLRPPLRLLLSIGRGSGIGRVRAIAWEPDAYRKFLEHILQELPKPTATVAAVDAAGYLLAHAAEHPGSVGKLCLVAPTWRGPLPTMMGRRAMFRFVSRLVDLPVIGSALYRLNVNQPMIRMMAKACLCRSCLARSAPPSRETCRDQCDRRSTCFVLFCSR